MCRIVIARRHIRFDAALIVDRSVGIAPSGQVAQARSANVQSPGTITTIEVLAQSAPDASNTPSGAPAVHQLITFWGQRADVAKVTVQPSKPRKVNAAFVRRWRTSDQLIKGVVRVNPVVATHQGRGCTFEAKLLACGIPTDPQQSALPYSLYPGQGISRQLGTSATQSFSCGFWLGRCVFGSSFVGFAGCLGHFHCHRDGRRPSTLD